MLLVLLRCDVPDGLNGSSYGFTQGEGIFIPNVLDYLNPTEYSVKMRFLFDYFYSYSQIRILNVDNSTQNGLYTYYNTIYVCSADFYL